MTDRCQHRPAVPFELAPDERSAAVELMRLRSILKLSQKQMAAHLYVSQSQYSKLERGTAVVTDEHLRLAREVVIAVRPRLGVIISVRILRRAGITSMREIEL